MADLGEVNQVSGVYGGVKLETVTTENTNQENQFNENAGTIQQPGTNLPAKTGLWNRFKTFWFQEISWDHEIKVELTPYQQKMEDEINDFLHQEVTWGKVKDFLFQKVSFGKGE